MESYLFNDKYLLGSYFVPRNRAVNKNKGPSFWGHIWGLYGVRENSKQEIKVIENSKKKIKQD